MSMIDATMAQDERSLASTRPAPPAADPLPRIETPIVPRTTISGRALVAVVAIMTFLASLTTGAVMLVRAAASEWQADVAREVTIQIRPAAGRDIEADIAKAVAIARALPGVAEVRPYSKEESGRLLEPWLGSRPATRRSAGPAHHRGADRVRRGARSRAIAQGAERAGAGCEPRRPSRLRRAHARDGRRGDDRRHRRAGARHRRDHPLGHIRDPRRHGDQPAGDRGAAFHRRQEQLHHRAFPAPFPAARAEGRRDRRRRRDGAVRPRRAVERLGRPAQPAGTRSRPCSARSRSGCWAMSRSSGRSC